MTTAAISSSNGIQQAQPVSNPNFEESNLVENVVKVMTVALAFFAIGMLFSFAPFSVAFAFSAVLIAGLALLFIPNRCCESSTAVSSTTQIDPNRVSQIDVPPSSTTTTSSTSTTTNVFVAPTVISRPAPSTTIIMTAPAPTSSVTIVNPSRGHRGDYNRVATARIARPPVDDPRAFQAPPPSNIIPPPIVMAPPAGGNVGFGSGSSAPSIMRQQPAAVLPIAVQPRPSNGNVGFGSGNAPSAIRGRQVVHDAPPPSRRQQNHVSFSTNPPPPQQTRNLPPPPQRRGTQDGRPVGFGSGHQ